MPTTTQSLLMESSLWDGKVYLNTWCWGQAGTASVTDKATGHEIGHVGVASVKDIDAACKAAAAAAPAWAAVAPERRAEIIRRAQRPRGTG
jgi:benzaldehyde dehydrogenase (NAD)